MIREMDQEDLQACAAIFTAAFSLPPYNEPWTVDAARLRLHELFGLPRRVALVAREGTGLAGFVLGALETGPWGLGLYCYELAVTPEAKGMGFGHRLMEAFEQAGKQAGVKHVWLIAHSGSDAAAFYGRRGYQVSSKVRVLTKEL